MRPPGFAHPWGVEAASTPDEPNETAYATRAKLVMPTSGPEDGTPINAQIRAIATRQHLLVSNSGPDADGYDYCVKCGRIESTSAPEVNLRNPHPLPYPNDDDASCEGRVSRGIVLGTDFQTDIALFALSDGTGNLGLQFLHLKRNEPAGFVHDLFHGSEGAVGVKKIPVQCGRRNRNGWPSAGRCRGRFSGSTRFRKACR